MCVFPNVRNDAFYTLFPFNRFLFQIICAMIYLGEDIARYGSSIVGLFIAG